MADAVNCPACGTGVEVAPGRCPKCGLLVGAPRPRAARPAPEPARGGGGWVIAAVVGALLMVGAGGGAVFYFRVQEERHHAARAEAAQQAMWLAEAQEANAQWARQNAADNGLAMPGVPAGDAAAPALDLLPLFPAAPLAPADAEARAEVLADRLAGVWRGPGAAGGTRVVEYRADGTFRDEVTGGAAPRRWVGRWEVERLAGARALRLTRIGGGPEIVRIEFEGEELIHDDEPGRATALRR